MWHGLIFRDIKKRWKRKRDRERTRTWFRQMMKKVPSTTKKLANSVGRWTFNVVTNNSIIYPVTSRTVVILFRELNKVKIAPVKNRIRDVRSSMTTSSRLSVKAIFFRSRKTEKNHGREFNVRFLEEKTEAASVLIQRWERCWDRNRLWTRKNSFNRRLLGLNTGRLTVDDKGLVLATCVENLSQDFKKLQQKAACRLFWKRSRKTALLDPDSGFYTGCEAKNQRKRSALL